MKQQSILFGLILIMACSNATDKNHELIKAVNDTSLEIRGSIITLSENEYRLDYYDISEPDSHYEYLSSIGFQGGGYTWEGIVYGAIILSEPDILHAILRFDPEAEGLSIWSTDKTSLEKIGRLISVVKRDDKVLLECITAAKKRVRME